MRKLAVLLLCLILAWPLAAAAYSFTDATGARISIDSPPQRVVCLVPGVSEAIVALGAGRTVVGVSWFDSRLLPRAAVVGGFLRPSVERIAGLKPQVIFLAGLHRRVRKHFAGRGVVLVQLEAHSLADIYRNLAILGGVFGREEQARRLVKRLRAQVELVGRKLAAAVPPGRRLRVMRLMGRERVMTPGDDSFQNAYIRAAGGIPPVLGKKGQVVEMTREQFRAFDPQVIYGCGGDRSAARRLLARPGWREVEAVRRGRLLWFPCELTCRASVRAGEFIAWLAASLYPRALARHTLRPDAVTGAKELRLELPYVKRARLIRSRLFDFPNQTLLVELDRPMAVLSTLEGMRRGVSAVGNHGFPPPCWPLLHHLSRSEIMPRVARVLGRSPADTVFLSTGADLKCLAVERAADQGLTAYALVTAGVASNAMRASRDRGLYREPGTINVIVLTNRRLTPRAMARAVITVTEAKTAALQDLDVRSSYRPRWPATGTGTDNLIVVQGAGPRADLTGGHTLLGQLLAQAVYRGVRRAVAVQNRLKVPRLVLWRLRERRVDLHRLCRGLVPGEQAPRLAAALEETLLAPEYAGLVEEALALQDAWQRGLVRNLTSWRGECLAAARRLARRPQADIALPPDSAGPLSLALQALARGLARHLGLAPRPPVAPAVRPGGGDCGC
jgi:ABC-type Fe3+-hydroxamate transport system substrate-binding protein/adenosylcobinamide amidohydrolase